MLGLRSHSLWYLRLIALFLHLVLRNQQSVRFSPLRVIFWVFPTLISLGSLVDSASLFEDAVDEFCILVRNVKLDGSL